MKRRNFFKLASLGALSTLVRETSATESGTTISLPATQDTPLPSLGSHSSLFEALAAPTAQPQMSFLNDEYQDVVPWREEALAYLRACLHYAPPECDPNPELIETVDCGTFTRERLYISTTPTIRIPVYVLIPKGLVNPAPALIALHGHGGSYFWGKEKLVHVEPEHPHLTQNKKRFSGGRSYADELAKRGYVVIVSDLLHFGERGLYFENDPERIKKRTADVTDIDLVEFNARSWSHEELVSRTALSCGATWAGINILDDFRVADYLRSRPEVDSKRMGCIGVSVGAVRAIFLGALHDSVRASVAVCWMAEYNQMIRNHVNSSIGYTKLVPGLYSQLGWQDLAGLHMPGHLMTINGLKDQLYPLKAARDAVEKITKMYAKAGHPNNYEGIFFDGPHEFNVAMQDHSFAWLDATLA